MRALPLTGIVAGLLFTVLAANPGSTSTPPALFHSVPGRFSVRATASPTQQENSVQMGSRTSKTHLFIFQTGRQSRIVSYTDHPTPPGQAINAAEMLAGVQAGFVTSVRGKLLKEKKIACQSFPGREVRVETREGVLMVLRAFVVKNRLYSLLAGARKAEFPEQEAAGFLDSFQVTR